MKFLNSFKSRSAFVSIILLSMLVISPQAYSRDGQREQLAIDVIRSLLNNGNNNHQPAMPDNRSSGGFIPRNQQAGSICRTYMLACRIAGSATVGTACWCQTQFGPAFGIIDQ